MAQLQYAGGRGGAARSYISTVRSKAYALKESSRMIDSLHMIAFVNVESGAGLSEWVGKMIDKAAAKGVAGKGTNELLRVTQWIALVEAFCHVVTADRRDPAESLPAALANLTMQESEEPSLYLARFNKECEGWSDLATQMTHQQLNKAFYLGLVTPMRQLMKHELVLLNDPQVTPASMTQLAQASWEALRTFSAEEDALDTGDTVGGSARAMAALAKQIQQMQVALAALTARRSNAIATVCHATVPSPVNALPEPSYPDDVPTHLVHMVADLRRDMQRGFQELKEMVMATTTATSKGSKHAVLRSTHQPDAAVTAPGEESAAASSSHGVRTRQRRSSKGRTSATLAPSEMAALYEALTKLDAMLPTAAPAQAHLPQHSQQAQPLPYQAQRHQHAYVQPQQGHGPTRSWQQGGQQQQPQHYGPSRGGRPPANASTQCFNCQGYGHYQSDCMYPPGPKDAVTRQPHAHVAWATQPDWGYEQDASPWSDHSQEPYAPWRGSHSLHA